MPKPKNVESYPVIYYELFEHALKQDKLTRDLECTKIAESLRRDLYAFVKALARTDAETASRYRTIKISVSNTTLTLLNRDLDTNALAAASFLGLKQFEVDKPDVKMHSLSPPIKASHKSHIPINTAQQTNDECLEDLGFTINLNNQEE